MLTDPGDDEPGSTSSSTPSHHGDALSRLVGAPADPAARVAAIALVVPGAAAFKQIEDRAEQVRSDALERFENAAAADKGRALQDFRWAADLAAELENVCARGYSAAGDWAGAERCWLSALWVVDHDFDDVDRWLHYLHQLRVNYLRWRRPHKALDMLDVAAGALFAAARFTESADTKISKAVIFTEVDQPDDAIATLKEAGATLRRAPAAPAAISFVRARLLAEDGVAHVLRGSAIAGRNRLRHALAILDDSEQLDDADEQRAERLTARVQRYLTELAAPRRERTRPAGSTARRGPG
jgi:tetratricopeptide (TPR) repeat protein